MKLAKNNGSLLATSLAPHPYTETNMLLVWGEPDAQHPLGLDASTCQQLDFSAIG